MLRADGRVDGGIDVRVVDVFVGSTRSVLPFATTIPSSIQCVITGGEYLVTSHMWTHALVSM